MPKQPGGPEAHAAAHMHACRENQGGGGGWWEPECQDDVTEDDRCMLTALTANAARARAAEGPTSRETGEGRCDGCQQERMFSTSTRAAPPSSSSSFPPPSTSCNLAPHIRTSTQHKLFRHGGARTKCRCRYFSAFGRRKKKGSSFSLYFRLLPKRAGE